MKTPPNRPPHGGRQSPPSTGLEGIVQKQAGHIAELERALQEVQDRNEILQKLFHFPAQFKAGVVEYAERRPFTFTYRNELFGPDNETFGFGALDAGEVRTAFSIDVDNPTHAVRISFAEIRTAHDNAPNPPINAYLPLSGLSPEGNLGSLAFRWRVKSSSDNRMWQTNWRDSVDVDMVYGYTLVCEHPLYRDDVLEIEAQSWGVRDDEFNERFSLFVSVHGYKMYEVYPHA